MIDLMSDSRFIPPWTNSTMTPPPSPPLRNVLTMIAFVLTDTFPPLLRDTSVEDFAPSFLEAEPTTYKWLPEATGGGEGKDLEGRKG